MPPPKYQLEASALNSPRKHNRKSSRLFKATTQFLPSIVSHRADGVFDIKSTKTSAHDGPPILEHHRSDDFDKLSANRLTAKDVPKIIVDGALSVKNSKSKKSVAGGSVHSKRSYRRESKI